MRVRFAPSPTGALHIGGARTALYNWLVARGQGGTLVLRIEDTDAERNVEGGSDALVEALRWLGLDWDEGYQKGGEHGPYVQTERLDRYHAAVNALIAEGRAYNCYCSSDELKARSEAQRAAGLPPGYDGHCRDLTDEQRAAYEAEGRSSVVRFRVPPARTIAFDDVVRGRIETAAEQINDFVIQRSDGSPVYMLAAAVDDMLMNITHVIRGEDLIAATPRQLLIREAMGAADVPVFAHLPLLVDDRGRPLSKRWGDVAVRAYREQGFLPQAMVNYLALLGWSYDDKTNVFSVSDLIEKFSLERVGKNPAAFDVAKLEWLNSHYLKEMDAAALADALVPFCVAYGLPADAPAARPLLVAVAPLLSERLKRLTDAPPMIAFLFGPVEAEGKAARIVSENGDYLNAVAVALEQVPEWTTPAIEAALRALAEVRDLKPKQAFQPVRAAVTGTLVSPPLFESLEILGRDETLERLRAVS